MNLIDRMKCDTGYLLNYVIYLFFGYSRILASRIFYISLAVFLYSEQSFSQIKQRSTVTEYCFLESSNKCKILARDFVSFDIIPNKDLLDSISINGKSSYVYFFDYRRTAQSEVAWNETISLLYEMFNWYFERYPTYRCFVFHNSGDIYLLDLPTGFSEVIVFIDKDLPKCKTIDVVITKKKIE